MQALIKISISLGAPESMGSGYEFSFLATEVWSWLGRLGSPCRIFSGECVEGCSWLGRARKWGWEGPSYAQPFLGNLRGWRRFLSFLFLLFKVLMLYRSSEGLSDFLEARKKINMLVGKPGPADFKSWRYYTFFCKTFCCLFSSGYGSHVAHSWHMASPLYVCWIA